MAAEFRLGVLLLLLTLILVKWLELVVTTFALNFFWLSLTATVYL